MRSMTRKYICYGLCAIAGLFIIMYNSFPCDTGPKVFMVNNSPKVVYTSDKTAIPYDKDMPLIFIGGMPRSGTTLMRAILDAHPEVRCGEETRVIPRMLGIRANWERSEVEKKRLNEAGITSKVLDSALTAFLLEIIAHHGEAAKYLCNKDPFTLKSSVYLNHLFPNAKFLFMIRDGRATVHSIIARKVTITGFDLKSYKSCLAKWNTAMEVMYSQCLRVGADKCMPVYYEQLVLQPQLWLRRITKFLKIPWNDSLLHHEDYIEKPGGIAVSK